MVRRWTTDVRVEWKPSLTFNMRRIRLAEWLEERVEPVALLDQMESVGIAVERPDVRIIVGPRSLTLTSGATGGQIQALTTVLDGVFEVLEPRDAVVSQVSTLVTTEIEADNYGDTAAAFARHVSNGTATVGGMRATDASALMDLVSDTHDVQVEWGVVDEAQLLFRLANPRVGRLRGSDRGGAVDEQDLQAIWRDQLPEISLLAEVVHMRRRGGKVSGSADVLHIAEDLAISAEHVVEDLRQGFWPAGGVSREFA